MEVSGSRCQEDQQLRLQAMVSPAKQFSSQASAGKEDLSRRGKHSFGFFSTLLMCLHRPVEQLDHVQDLLPGPVERGTGTKLEDASGIGSDDGGRTR